mgnify:FL=1
MGPNSGYPLPIQLEIKFILTVFAELHVVCSHRPTRAFVSTRRTFVSSHVRLGFRFATNTRPMSVVGAVAALGVAAAAVPTAVARRTPGGLLPLRRATVPLQRRRVGSKSRVGVAAHASLTEFPQWDTINDAAINLHASVIGNGVFQVADAAAVIDAEEIPGIQKGGWLGPITDALEFTLEVS